MSSSRPGRAPWLIAAALFSVSALGFGALTDNLPVPEPIQPVAEVAGAGEVKASPAPASSPASAHPTVGSRRPLVDVPPDEIRPLAPHALRGYRWPLRKGRLTLGFQHTPWGSRLVGGKRFHDGIDLATFCGDRVTAAHDGIVLAAGRRFDNYVGWIGDLGPYHQRLTRKGLWRTLPIVVIIDDENGYRSVYAHFSRVKVKRGQRVKAGQLLGWEGRTGRASGCHLHYGLFSPLETARIRIHPDTVKRMKVPRWQIARVDPLRVLPPRRGFPEPITLAPTDLPR